MAPRAASSLPPPAAVPASSASGACDPVLDSLEACRSEPSLIDGPLGRLLKDDLSYSAPKDSLHRTLTKFKGLPNDIRIIERDRSRCIRRGQRSAVNVPSGVSINFAIRGARSPRRSRDVGNSVRNTSESPGRPERPDIRPDRHTMGSESRRNVGVEYTKAADDGLSRSDRSGNPMRYFSAKAFSLSWGS